MEENYLGYYYCSLETFLNIIKNQTIYLSDPLKMNDSEEIKWAIKKMDSNLFGQIIQRSYLSDIDKSDLIKILEEKGQNNVFISCFSKKEDLLSQWRAYGDNGNGVALGFDLNKLAKPGQNIRIKKVIYSNQIKKEYLRESQFEIAADTLSIAKQANDGADYDDKELLLDELLDVCLEYKNPCFVEEDEVRLIYKEIERVDQVIEAHSAWSNREYHYKPLKLEHSFRIIRKNDITEYVIMPIENAVEKIIIGPRSMLKIEDAKKIIKQYIPNNTISIKKSDASYR